MNEEIIEVYEGSGNVFEDLGLENAEELYTRSKIGFQVLTILQARKLKQGEVASLLNIEQADVALLMRGRFNHFSTERLLNFAFRSTIIDEPYRSGGLAPPSAQIVFLNEN